MKSIFKHSALIGAAFLLLGLSSCKQESIDTAQYADDAVTLASFGPNPVMRGGQLRFFGSNLDRIESVNVPGIDPIKTIEVVKAGKVGEIRVTLPVEGPEVGYVILKSKDGEEFKTISELTYTEPIVFDGFEAVSPAFPGDVIMLKGDYMNLVKSVEFTGGTKVAVEEGATRHEASVIIPADALTGKITISDGGSVENLFYSEADLVIGEPTVKKAADATIKAGKPVTITGAHLEMIEKLIVGGVEITDFSLAEDNASITFTLPAQSASGSILAVSFAGKEYNAGGIETVAPKVTSVSPAPVKAGKILTIAGENLDLITSVDFNGAENATFTYENGKISVAVPNTAKEGTITFKLANGSSVEAEFTLVHPTITKVAPSELYAGDEPVKVSGTDLDLVVKATLGGKEVELGPQTATELSLNTTASSVSGKVELTLANGETVMSDDEVTLKYHSKVIVKSIPAAQHIGEEVIITGEKLNLVETIYVGTTKVTAYSIRKDDEIRFLMPWCSVGSYNVSFVLYDGDTEVQPSPIEVQLEREFKTIFEGSQKVAWNDDAPYLDAPGDKALQKLAWGGYDWTSVQPGTTLMVSLRIIPDDGYSQIRFGNGNWSPLPGTPDTYDLASDATFASIVLDNAKLAALAENGLVLCGNGYEITKVELISEISQEITIFEGPCDMTWGDDGRFGLAKEAFEGLVPGSKLIFYITHTHDWGQIQLNDGWWGNGDIVFPEVGGAYIKTDNIPAGATRVELTLTEDVLAKLLERTGGYVGVNTAHTSPSGNYSMVIQGGDMRVDKVTVLK